MTIEAIALLAISVCVGAFLQGTVGVGFAMLVAPIAALVEPSLVPVAILIWMLPLNALVAWRERRHIDLRGAGWITVARVLATPLGIWLLLLIPENHLGYLIGGTTILAALVSFAAPSFTPRPAAFLAAGAVTALSETATGVGGPPLALVYQHRPAAELRATVALCFLIGEVISLIALALGGQFGGSGTNLALWLLPAVIVGVWTSSVTHKRVGGAALRYGILLFALASGIAVIIGTL
ncbi:sulfite exporter TauE/SafE family protein [Paramicrobacterium chengjingii]|uniref:sulfite exporter TauE/SafE family protein n=1 Tax=Paramicrobacterium chengjingii TaxID=2769067 RepID=UPI001423D55A|nr:sulfite exporter TauE/SafE family protein [Microbacterium chengjingii]